MQTLKKKSTHHKVAFLAGALLIAGALVSIGLVEQQDVSDAVASVMRTTPSTPQGDQNCTKPFYDVPCNSPYLTSVQWAKDKGILTGYADGTLQGHKAINRAEALKLIFSAKGLTSNTLLIEKPFPDVDITSWYAPFVSAGKDLGILSGDKNGRFRGIGEVIQAEFIKMSLVAFNLVPSSSTETPWYKPYMTFAEQNKLFPFEYTKNIPQKVVSRYDAIESLYRIAKYNVPPVRTAPSTTGNIK